MLGILARLAPKYPIGFAPGFNVHAQLVCRARKLEVNPKGTIGCLCQPTRASGIRLVSNRYPIFPVLRPGEAGLLLSAISYRLQYRVLVSFWNVFLPFYCYLSACFCPKIAFSRSHFRFSLQRRADFGLHPMYRTTAASTIELITIPYVSDGRFWLFGVAPQFPTCPLL